MIISILIVVILWIMSDELIMSFAQRRIGPFNLGWYGITSNLINGLNLIIVQLVIPRVSSNSFSLIVLIFLGLCLSIYCLLPPFILLDLWFNILIIIIGLSISIIIIVFISLSSYSKYSLLSSIRLISQLLSFELVFSTIIVFMVYSYYGLSVNSYYSGRLLSSVNSIISRINRYIVLILSFICFRLCNMTSFRLINIYNSIVSIVINSFIRIIYYHSLMGWASLPSSASSYCYLVSLWVCNSVVCNSIIVNIVFIVSINIVSIFSYSINKGRASLPNSHSLIFNSSLCIVSLIIVSCNSIIAVSSRFKGISSHLNSIISQLIIRVPDSSSLISNLISLISYLIPLVYYPVEQLEISAYSFIVQLIIIVIKIPAFNNIIISVHGFIVIIFLSFSSNYSYSCLSSYLLFNSYQLVLIYYPLVLLINSYNIGLLSLIYIIVVSLIQYLIIAINSFSSFSISISSFSVAFRIQVVKFNNSRKMSYPSLKSLFIMVPLCNTGVAWCSILNIGILLLVNPVSCYYNSWIGSIDTQTLYSIFSSIIVFINESFILLVVVTCGSIGYYYYYCNHNPPFISIVSELGNVRA